MPVVATYRDRLTACGVRSAAVTCLLAAAAACGHPDPPAPGPRAPRVARPLFAGAATAYPCTALTDAQAVRAGAPAGARHREVVGRDGPSCVWGYAAAGPVLTVAWPVDTPGLDALYARRGEQAYWAETTVLGYPAVFADTRDGRARGRCVLHVGVSDRTSFSAALDTRGTGPAGDACAAARRAAISVLDGLRRQ